MWCVSRVTCLVTLIVHPQSLPNIGVFYRSVCYMGGYVVCVNLSISSQVIGDILTVLRSF